MKSLHVSFFLVLLTLGSQSAWSQCWEQVWEDNFDGTALDMNKWSYETGNGCQISQNMCGWGNGEKQFYTSNSNNVSVSGGMLNITARYAPNYNNSNISDFTSGRIHTRGKHSWLYGKMEARILLPGGTGVWPAFWMLPRDNSYGGWPTSGEIDVMEFRGDQTNHVDGTLHYGSSWPQNQWDGTPYTLSSGNFTQNFHVFTVEWTPGVIKWFVDGNLYKTETQNPNSLNPASNNAVTWPWDRNFYLILNVAVGGWYPGNPTTSAIINGNTNWTRTMQVDYVRVYTDISNGAFANAISGNSAILRNETSTYSSTANAGATYAWNVTGGTIASGQGTNAISVNWGTSNGTVSLTKTLNCGTGNFSLPTNVQPTHCGQVLEDFENNRFNSYGFINGVFNTKVNNPNTAQAQNTSSTCGRYDRNASEAYDVLILENPGLGNADLFKNGVKRFALDVYSNAAGRNVEITLENSATATPSNYPTGRHTTYRATTTRVNEWETLYFTRISIPDANTAGTAVNRLVLMFTPGTATSGTYFIDNLLVDNQPYATSNITGSATFCNNETRAYSVTGSTGSTYTWTLPAGASITNAATAASVNVQFGSSNGTISVVENNSANCTSTPAKTLSVSSTGNCTTDLISAEEAGIEVSPIPADAQLSVVMPNKQSYRWQLFSAQGKEMGRGQQGSGVPISIEQYAPGVYMLMLEQNGTQYLRRIVIE